MKRFLTILLILLLIFLSGCKLMILAIYNPNAVVIFMVDQESTLEVRTVEKGNLITPPSIEKEGYELLGWATYEQLKQEYGSTWNFQEELIFGDMIFYPCWNIVNPTGIDIYGGSSVAVNETINLYAQVNPYGASRNIIWSSSNPEIATIDSVGVVTGISVGTTVICATSQVDSTIKREYIITVTQDPKRPNFRGYTIRIAQSAELLHTIDPFRDDYVGNDKLARQRAWRWVEDNYNCKIMVIAYPPEAPEGTMRWNYIMDAACSKTPAYDFYCVPDAMIPQLARARALRYTNAWYEEYGEDMMDPIYIESGSYEGYLYSITDEITELDRVLYYNTTLLKRLGLEKTPAQLFNDGDWTYSTFLTYATAAQTALNHLPKSTEHSLYALSGSTSDYWLGMTHAGGTKIVDLDAMKFQPTTPHASAAINVLKSIYAAGAMNPENQVGTEVVSWMNGESLFSTGYLSYILDANYWSTNPFEMDYVPFPRPDDITKEAQAIGMGGTNTVVMAADRDYYGYGSGSHQEHIYWAYVEMLQKTKEYYYAEYPELATFPISTIANFYTDSVDSATALEYMLVHKNERSFFDPLANPNNLFMNMDDSAFANTLHNYVKGIGANFPQAISQYQTELQRLLQNLFS